tara:strand:- start:4024 stop:4221 length:198 start_codon:yes stop_codon:yes gene_type:complete
MHNVEDYYRKIEFLHTRALELHRERYKTTGSYDELACQRLIDDIKYLALIIYKSEVDLEIDFGKK